MVGNPSFLQQISPIAGAAIDAIGSVGGGLFSANQARKNRAFQERMYKKQVEDNRDNWRMQVEYADPSNERARIEKAGLNPLLMYGQGGLMSTVSTPQGGTAPHGDSAKGSFNTNFGQAMFQSAMMQAQLRNLESVTQKNETEAEESRARTEATEYNTMFRRLSQDIELSMKHHQDDLLQVQVEKLRNDMFVQTSYNSEMMQTLRQARQYEVKRFNLDSDTIGEKLRQTWEQVKSGRISANAAYRQSSAALWQASTAANLANWQIGQIAQNILWNDRFNPLIMERYGLENNLLRWDSHLKKAAFSEKQLNIFNQTIRNYNLQNFGSEELFKSQLGGTIRDISKPFYDLFMMW